MPKNEPYSEPRAKGEQPKQGPSSEGGSGVIRVPREVIDGTAADPEPGEVCYPGEPPVDPRA